MQGKVCHVEPLGLNLLCSLLAACMFAFFPRRVVEVAPPPGGGFKREGFMRSEMELPPESRVIIGDDRLSMAT